MLVEKDNSSSDSDGVDADIYGRRRSTKVADKFLLPLAIFKQHCKSAKTIDNEIFDHILIAFGVDCYGKNPTIDQYQYVALYAFIRYNCLSEAQQIVIWARVFDPQNRGKVEKADYERILFYLASGGERNWKR